MQMTNAIPTVSMGLSGIADWSAQHPFLDRFKTARDWVPNSATEWDSGIAIPRDAQGWPKSMPAGVSAITTIVGVDPASEWPSGRYVVLYDGKGKIDYSLTSTKVAGTAGRDIVVVNDTDGDVGHQSMFLSITQTDPSDPIRNIRVVREDQLSAFQDGEIFNPAFLDKLEDFRALRFMDWMETNNSDIRNWSDRPAMDDASWQVNGVPVEAMVELANRTGTDPWFCMPHNASDEFIRQFASYVRDHLDPRLKAHVEYSNEVWNWSFEQASFAMEEANKRWAKDANGNGKIDENERIGDGWMQYSGMRAAETHRIWTEVFGTEAPARLERVIATQTAWLGLETPMLTAPLYVAEGKLAPWKTADSYAIAGYFEGGLYKASNLATVKLWASQGEAGMAKAFQQLEFGNLIDDGGQSLADLKTVYAYHAAVAKKYGMDLTMYESGAHLVANMYDDATNAILTEFFGRLQRDERMGELYAKNAAAFRAAGGTMFNAFVDVSSNSKHGFWGALESIYDTGSARWDALVAANETGADWANRNASAFTNGVLIQGTAGNDARSGSAGGDRILGKDGDDRINGLDGSDILSGGNGKDWMSGGAGSDEMAGGAGDDFLFGGADRDRLSGGAGNDRLAGGLGADRLIGGAGLDLADYSTSASGVTARFDKPSLNAGEARGDSYSEIEGLIGSRFRDVLVGNPARDAIYGGDGNDTIYGLGGNDGMTGQGGDDYLVGGDGDDAISGGIGMDVMVGGAGRDSFYFTTRASASNVDTIRDFVSSDDLFRLDDTAFEGIGVAGVLGAARFVIAAAAADALDRIIYEKATGKLYFDADGTGIKAKVHFATLAPNAVVGADDFLIF
jgi:hypothetical protein